MDYLSPYLFLDYQTCSVNGRRINDCLNIIKDVIYDANLLPNKKLNPKNPVYTYWIRFGEKSQKEELTTIQRTLAYGLYTNPIVGEPDAFEGYFLETKAKCLTHA